MLHLPAVDRALWHSTRAQAHLMSAAVAGHHYAVAAIDAVGIVLVALSFAGSLYVLIGLARRVATLGRRWSAGRPVRTLLTTGTGLAVLTALAALWAIQGQFCGW